MYAKGTAFINGQPTPIVETAAAQPGFIRSHHVFTVSHDSSLAWKKQFCTQKNKGCFCNVEEVK